MENQLILIEDLGMLYPKETSKVKRHYVKYKCFCGNEFTTQISSVKKQLTKSCGCLKNKDKITHNLTNHRLYGTWKMMIDRCTNEKNDRYNDYGGRGVIVCDRWLDVANFIEDMYPSYIEGLTIDRINNDLGYSKDNCRWASKTTQNRNTRKLKKINTSGYRGVSFHNNSNMWRSRIRVNYKHVHLGYFKTALEAAKAYDNYVIKNNLEHTINGIGL